MKKYLITLFIIMLGLKFSSFGQAVSVVRDKYKQKQLENMVFIRWGDFKPKWYYFLFHNKYRKGPDRRTILQLVPTDLVIRQTEEKSEEQGEDVQRMYAMQYWDAISRQLEIHYIFHFKPIFEQLNKDIDELIAKGTSIKSSPVAIDSFREEQRRLNGEIEIIRDGWLEKGDSGEAMKVIENDLRKLKGDLLKFNRLQAINYKYQNIQP